MLCFLGLGSNLGTPEKNILDALDRVAALSETSLLGQSRLYRTAPVGVETTSYFVNAVAKTETDISPRALMARCLEIERAFGRDRTRGPDRELDIDILFYGNCIVWEYDLKIPHPRLAQRAFVLAPWMDLAPDLVLRPWGSTVESLLCKTGLKGIEVIK